MKQIKSRRWWNFWQAWEKVSQVPVKSCSSRKMLNAVDTLREKSANDEIDGFDQTTMCVCVWFFF